MARVDVLPQATTTRGRTAPVVVVLLAGAAVTVASAAALAGGDVPVPGLPDAGPVTALALPVARLVHDVLAAGTVGALLLEGVLLPQHGRACAVGVGRVAGWASAWAVATVVWAVLSLSEVLAVPVQEIPDRGDVLSLVLTSQLGLAQLSTTWLAVLVALVAGTRPGLALTRTLLLVALAALVPTAVIGHAGSHGDPVLGVASMSLHLAAATTWVGGLLAVVVHLRGRPDLLAVAVPRFSRVALVCVVLLGTSGLLGASTVLAGWDELWSVYGLLLLVKVLLLGVLVVVGAAHRRSTVGAAAAGRPTALLRLALGELVVMGAAVGVAVTLASVGP